MSELEYEQLIREKEVTERWPAIAKSVLRAARFAKTIRWVKGKQGTAWYRPSDIEEFIKTHLERSPTGLEVSRKANSSPTPSTASDMSELQSKHPELVKAVAHRLAEEIMAPAKRRTPRRR